MKPKFYNPNWQKTNVIGCLNTTMMLYGRHNGSFPCIPQVQENE